MNVKTFRATNFHDALALVHEELGENAKVLDCREFKERGFLGLFSKPVVEITATIMNDPEPKRVADPFFELLRESPYDVEIRPPLDQHRFRTETIPEPEEDDMPVPLGLWMQTQPDEINPTVLQRSLIVLFQKSIRFGGPLRLVPGRRRTVALVGPTGVGKTTTLMKIATHYRQKTPNNVALLSLDPFRIGAAEQLRQFAQSLGVPMESITEPGQIRPVLERFGAIDLLLIDTPGASPKNVAKLHVIGDALDAAETDEIHLLLPATSSAGNLREAIRGFQPLGVSGLTFTKLDETVGLGDLYPILKEDHFPLRFLATGQAVAADIEVAGPARLASLAHTE